MANADNVPSKLPKGKRCYNKEYIGFLVRSGLVRIMYARPDGYFISLIVLKNTALVLEFDV